MKVLAWNWNVHTNARLGCECFNPDSKILDNYGQNSGKYVSNIPNFWLMKPSAAS